RPRQGWEGVWRPRKSSSTAPRHSFDPENASVRARHSASLPLSSRLGMQRFLAHAALALSLLAVPLQSRAQDLDLDPDAGKPSRKAAKRTTREAVVREIERGVYLKSSIGGVFLLGPRSSVLQNGTALSMTVGMDVIDKP